MISEKNFDINLNPSNTFTSDVPIKGKAYCRVFIDLIGEGSWQIVPDNTYDIINDVIVFPIQPTGKFVSLQVSTTPAELTQSPTENSMILTIKNEIKSVADNMENIINVSSKIDVIAPNIVKIVNVSDNMTKVSNVDANMIKVSNVYANMSDVDTVSTNILSVNNVSDNMIKVSNVYANMSDVDTVSTNILSVNNVSTNILNVNNVSTNMTKVSNVDANMSDINNAEENAQLAIQYKNLAQKWASELEDVVVADGKYSAYHWALKAYQLVTEGVINDITASGNTTYSSNKLETLLSLKANLLNPKFTENVSIGNIVLSSWASSYSVVEGIDSSFCGNDGINTIIGNNCYFNGTNWLYKNNGKATLQILSADNHTFKTTSSGSAGDIITWNTVATLGNDNVIVPYIQNQIDTVNNRLDAHIPLSGITSYHLLQGNLSVSNEVITNGFSTTLYTGNAATQSINTGIDMATQWGNDVSETFGGLVWGKSRSSALPNLFFDTIRGATKYIQSNDTSAEDLVANTLTSFNSNGFSIGATLEINTNLATYASWNFQTTHRRTGVTNHGKTYTEHYNLFTGFTIIKYEGSGLAGHEIPHSLGRKLGFWLNKNLTAVTAWNAQYRENYNLNMDTAAEGASSIVGTNNSETSLTIGTGTLVNTSTNQYIMYGWADSYLDESNKLIGNYEIGAYQGTGVAGNKVTTRGKPAWIMINRLDGISNWRVLDNQRTNGTPEELYPNLGAAEVSSVVFTININGFSIDTTDAEINASGGQYLYMVVYDNDSGSGKSKYPKATDTSNVQINNAIIPLAHGVDSNGSKNSIVIANETITGLTYTGGKNYLYKTDTGFGVKSISPSYGKVNPLIGDFYNVITNKWYSNTNAEITESRNYLNHIVHADQNGQVTYVEEIPKIEYKDVIKAYEYRGKNACTMWAVINGSTTPPTILGGYGISGVIKTVTGKYELIPNKEFDNTILAVSGISSIPTAELKTLELHTTSRIKVQLFTGSAFVDALFCVHIDGGRN